MLRKNRSGPSNLIEDAKYINKMLFRAITFNITHTLLSRVDITYRILPTICTVFQSVNFLHHDTKMNEKKKCTLYLHSNVLNRSRRCNYKHTGVFVCYAFCSYHNSVLERSNATFPFVP